MQAGGDSGPPEARGAAATVGRFDSTAPLFVGCPALFIQTQGTVKALEAAASLVHEEGMGVVFTMGPAKSHLERLGELTKAYRELVGPMDQVMFDANRYSGQNRRVGAEPLAAAWIEAQHAAGVRMALTDSPYLPAGDRSALVSTLSQARGLGDGVMAVLPLHLQWLTKDSAVLIEEINKAGVPVALVLEHRDDPLGVQAAVSGLVKVLDAATVTVSLLRSDLSVIGAIAFGASMGAVGTTTGLRHNYPQGKKSGGGRPAPSIGAFVPWSMGYRTLQKINAAIAADPDHQERWRCLCRFCGDQMLDCIVSEVQAYQHSLAAIAVLGEKILADPGPAERRLAWVLACSHAQIINLEIAYDTAMNWEPPAYLAGWQKLPPVPAAVPALTQKV